jgi:hypothetical protein
MMDMDNIAGMHQKSHHKYLPLVLFPYGNFASSFAHAAPELLAQFAAGAAPGLCLLISINDWRWHEETDLTH